MKNSYNKQAELLLSILPLINREPDFALKGGTAINYFIRNLPRISVDIDLTYLPLTSRETALTAITDKLQYLSELIKKTYPGSLITGKRINKTRFLKGIIIRYNDVTVKVEPNLIIRGSVYPPQIISLSKKAEQLFERELSVLSLSIADLYGSKICAALDRQHPRDLFDIKLLIENEGITDNIRKAFIVYLCSHPRPILEILNPHLLDITSLFRNEFQGMTNELVELEDLHTVRLDLIKTMSAELTQDEKQFLISFKEMKPNWELLKLNRIEQMPAIRWKLYNLNRMDERKHRKALDDLKSFLYRIDK